MVSKTKRTLAIVLAGMMAAGALAGCQQGTTPAPSGGTGTASTPAASTGTGDTSEGTGDTAKPAATPIFTDEMTAKIKDKMATEAEANEGVIKLKIWCSGDDREFENALIEEFKTLYGDSRYEFKISVQGAFGEDKSAGAILQDPQVGADIFNFADDQLRSLVQAGAIASISPIFNNNVVADNTEAAVEVCSIDGTPYAFPRTSDNGYFMYYDKTVFDAADLKTFDGMVAKAKEKKTNVLMAVDNAWYNSGFFFTAGVKINLKDGKTQEGNFDSPEGLSGAKAIAHLSESAEQGFKGSGDDSAVVNGFANGTVKAAVTGTWNGPAIKEKIGEENLGAVKLPTVLMDGEQKQLCSFGGYKVEGVNAATKFPVSAQALAYYLTCPESQLKRYYGIQDASGNWMKDKKGVKLRRGFVPTASTEAMNAVETAYLKDAVEALKTDEAAQAIEAQRPFSQPQSNAGGKYWTPVGGIGGEIYTAKGNLTEAQLQEKLKKVEQGFAG